jgi:CTP:molybdopterin cytidylyltransferase MocA
MEEVVVVGPVVKAAVEAMATRAVVAITRNPTRISPMSSSVSRATVLRRLRNKFVGFLRMSYFA